MKGHPMVLVNEPLGYRICLECEDVLAQAGGDTNPDAAAWLAIHLGHEGCSAPTSGRLFRRRRRKA